MAEVEDVTLVRQSIQYAINAFIKSSSASKEHKRIEISLNGRGIADHIANRIQRFCPIDPNRINLGFLDIPLDLKTGSFRKPNDAR